MTYLARAMNSSDLSHKETRCDTDTLQAAGLTAGASPTLSLGVLLKEAYEGATGDSAASVERVRVLQAEVARLVVNQSNKSRLKVDAHEIACQMVQEFMLNQCPRCQGRGFLPISYGETASDDLAGAECPDCLGSGQGAADYKGRERALGMKYTGRAAELWEKVLTRMEWAKAMATYEIKQRLR